MKEVETNGFFPHLRPLHPGGCLCPQCVAWKAKNANQMTPDEWDIALFGKPIELPSEPYVVPPEEAELNIRYYSNPPIRMTKEEKEQWLRQLNREDGDDGVD